MTHQPRPNVLPAKTHCVRTGCEKVYIIVSFLDGRPFEVFMIGAGAGCCQCSQNEAVGRLVSLLLRGGFAIDEIVVQLAGIHCEKASIVGRSCPDAVAQVLKEYVNGVPETVAAPEAGH